MNVYVWAISFCLVFIFISVELIRRQKLQEQYAILWLVLGFIMALFSVFPSLLDQVSHRMHIYYAPSLFLVGLLFSLVFIMHLTLVISKLHRKLTRLIQEVALLQEQLRGKGSE
ncbi:DUF2304 domain-containing protein [Paenibacillus alginolyticus]|uniref:DUF2304 domain-containing protein n=1 Tax=Paenibacillus alginolyticus TaxID=59839 RepID=A0ABT4GJ45_9BACL|nr:DUF2304 domain-containing protein [Paenibacillus alginolyticus]MCY9696218.1 DUF2304 domain-containing protein [Paenibacillus alginolyticus]MEC0142494.1 DUF2304 domain-containing protein [Paenibacillus alginolyticus]